MRLHIARLAVILSVLPCLACAQAPAPVEPVEPVAVNATAYPWLAEWSGEMPPMAPLESVFQVPDGFERVEVVEGGFGKWLRGLPVRLDRSTVRLHNGVPISAPAAAVILLDVGEGDLQQCADSILRLHAEYLWATGQSFTARYHFTSGDPSGWREWVSGESFRIRGSRVERVRGSARTLDHRTFRGWLQHLFVYAGTLSLDLDSEGLQRSAVIEAGDFFVEGGSPGHAVIVLDVAESAGGSRVGLIGQGYTPAQDFHVLGERRQEVLGGVWFPLPAAAGESLEVPSWRPFPRSSARRFPGPGE